MSAGPRDASPRRPADPIRAGRKALDIVHLCTLAPLSESMVREIDPALTALLRQAEASIRARVALKLADCSWAPLEAVRALAFDEVKLCEPILLRSPRLDDETLVQIAGHSREHRRTLAARSPLSADVTAAVSAYREPECLHVLAANAGASLGPASAPDFACGARGDEALQARLVDREDLDPAIARALHAIAVERVRTQLAAAFPELDPARSGRALDDQLEDASLIGEEGAAQSLTARLMARSALGKADVLRAAKGGRFDIADHAIANLTGAPVADWRHALGRSPLRTSLLAARTMAMTLEEAAELYTALVWGGRGHEMAPDALAGACRDVYTGFSRDNARRALHRMGAGASISKASTPGHSIH